MTQIGESVAVTQVEDPKTGGLRVTVRDKCDGSRIKGAIVSVGTKTQTTDDSGETTFSDLPAGPTQAMVNKHFKEADYLTFFSHIMPRIVRRKEAKSSAWGDGDVPEGGEGRMRVEIDAYKIIDKIRFRRLHLKLKPLDYGHWWVEVGNKSYGWWPEQGHLGAKDMEEPQPPPPLGDDPSIVERIQHMAARAGYSAQMARYNANKSKVSVYAQAIAKTFVGVPGILNGDEDGKRLELDPHHGDKKFEEEYSPVVNDCTTIEELQKKIRDFAFSYQGEWSWRFEYGRNCHTFQIEMIKTIGIEKFKDWKA
jgi:hypothetical protein